MPEGVILLNETQQIVEANRLGEAYLTRLGESDVNGALTHLGDVEIKRLLYPPPTGLWHKLQGQERKYQVVAKPFEPESTPTGWVLVIRDITQQSEFEQRAHQQERLAAVGQLAAGIAIGSGCRLSHSKLNGPQTLSSRSWISAAEPSWNASR